MRTACTYDCPDACSLLGESGPRGLVLKGDPLHPITRGTICPRLRRHAARLGSPLRLTSPRRRVGGAWEDLTWDAALGLLSERLRTVLEEHGPAAVVSLRGGGSLGISKELVCHFWNRLGPTTWVRGGLCGEAGEAAQAADFGDAAGHDYTDLAQSRAVVLWGKNPSVTGRHFVPFIREARARGAPVFLVEPRPTESTRLADRWIRVAPGGDGALALAVLHRLREDGALETEARAENGAEFAAWLATAAPSRSTCEAQAGVSPEEVRTLAALYRDRTPVATWVGWGLQRRAHGAQAVRFIDALALLSGQVGRAGGGVNFTSLRRRGLDRARLAQATGRSLAAPRLAEELTALRDPPAQFLYVTAANPVTQCPDSLAVARALRELPFVVVADAFFTDTAEAADLVLPTTLMLEEEDVVGSYQHHHLAVVRPVAAPPLGAQSDLWILRELGKRLGLPPDPLLEEPRQALAALTAPWFPAPPDAREETAPFGPATSPPGRNPFHRAVPFPPSESFPTASGKARLCCSPPLLPPEVPGYPLLLLSPAEPSWQASQVAEEAQIASREAGEPLACTVHPEAAQAAGLGPGRLALLESPLSSLRVRIVLDDRVHPTLCVVPRGSWLRHGGGVNRLVAAQTTDLGEGAAFYDQRVRLAPFPTDPGMIQGPEPHPGAGEGRQNR